MVTPDADRIAEVWLSTFFLSPALPPIASLSDPSAFFHSSSFWVNLGAKYTLNSCLSPSSSLPHVHLTHSVQPPVLDLPRVLLYRLRHLELFLSFFRRVFLHVLSHFTTGAARATPCSPFTLPPRKRSSLFQVSGSRDARDAAC